MTDRHRSHQPSSQTPRRLRRRPCSQSQSQREPLVQAAYEVDLFRRIADQASAARSSYLASQAARDSRHLAVASAVANGYVTLLSFDARLEIARETLAARSESLRIIRSRVTNGYSPSLDLAQAEADYQATAQNSPRSNLASPARRTRCGCWWAIHQVPCSVGPPSRR